MAMDKEKLLAWFQSHYLSRQEVLYKLPLNLSIGSFWPELLNRRKAGATVLPLYNASGIPYWYVLTDKMVAASERLCEEAFAQEKFVDPYKAQMTSAMTEEMFFTSFVEGAQIPLQEAMDFLQRGTEPENIQEQMIWNNRHAWTELVATLYRPLDEGFIKALAFMLTEEMDGCAQDYRQADNHPIAAMGSETYDLPPSYALPDRMREYCAFLGQPDIHPLIKSAVAQAYILIIRPFPEGNERLSRMLSSAVLLRCGYDFFRDISLSAVIAKESYRYYKSMRDILRPENGGDLTYFVEYFLELLVRAVDARKERLRRREQEALEKEREMARQPLQGPDTPIQTAQGKTNVTTQAVSTSGQSSEEKTDKSALAEVRESAGVVFSETELWPAERFFAEADKMLESRFQSVRRIPQRLRDMIYEGILSFTLNDWAERNNQTLKGAGAACRKLHQMGLLIKSIDTNRLVHYTFRIDARSIATGTPAVTANCLKKPSEGMLACLRDMQKSDEASKRRISLLLLGLVNRGQYSFTWNDWKDGIHLASTAGREELNRAVCMGLICRSTILGENNQTVYMIREQPPDHIHIADLTIAEKYYLACIYRDLGTKEFTIEECKHIVGLSKKQATDYLERFSARGLVSKSRLAHNQPNTYRVIISPHDHPDCFIPAETLSQTRTRSVRPRAASRSIAAVG